VGALSKWVDRFLGSDPGLNRFRMATEALVSIGLTLLAEWGFVRLTHAMLIEVPAGVTLPAAKAAVVAVANHEFTVVAMMLGAIVGMMSSFGVADPKVKGQLISMLWLPVIMIPSLALGIAIGPYRIPALTSFAVLLAIGTYCRRFGPRGFMSGMLLFMGDFMGFFLHTAITMGDLGWLSAEIGVGLVVAAIVRFTLFFPRPRKALQRTQRSYVALAQKVARLALDLFDDPEHQERDIRRLQRHIVRLNEAALMTDALLGDPGAVADGSSGQLLHQRLFDAELNLTNMARFAQAATRLDIPAACRAEIRGALLGIVNRDAEAARSHANALITLVSEGVIPGDVIPGTAVADGTVPDAEDRTTIVILRRLASSVIGLTDALTSWLSLGETSESGSTFQPAVILMGAWLPGSAMVSGAASTQPGTRRLDRVTMPPYLRTAIQVGLAVGIVTVLGDAINGRRFYWAILAAFITFMGANNSAEQLRKAFYRVFGTAIGIALGSLFVHLTGGHTVSSIVVILVSLFVGLYLFRVNYTFMVIGITVMISQLYVQLDEFSNSLLLMRLAETSMGAAVTALVVLLIIPLRTRRVLRVAFSQHVDAVRQMTAHATSRLLGEDGNWAAVLRADARAVDAAYHALTWTAMPLRRNLFGSLDKSTAAAVRMATGSRYYCQNLAADVEAAGPLDKDTRLAVKQAGATLDESLGVISAAVTGSRDVLYTRSSALFDQAERRLEATARGTGPAQLAIRDLKLLDGAMAGLAKAIKVRITSFDTDAAQTQEEGAVPVRGRVLNPGGTGVAMATLTLIDAEGGQVALGTSAGDGSYEIYAPPVDGSYSLIVSAPGRPPAASAVTVRHAGYGPGIRMDVLLAGNSDLRGTVRSAGGSAVPGTRVTLLNATGDVVAASSTDSDGRYDFPGLPEGDYTTVAGGYPSGVTSVRITGGENTVRHDLTVPQSGQ
jgi:uncharacterized membrane protein YccC